MNITQFYDLVISCLNYDYNKRPDAGTVYNLFHTLITLWLFGEETNDSILTKYRLGESVPVDTHGHPLILSNTDMKHYEGDGWYCSICQNKEKFFFITCTPSTQNM